MPYSRLKAPIKTDKHEITWSDLAIDASANKARQLVLGVASADKDSSFECEVGSRVNAIYIEVNIAAQTVTNPKVLHWIVMARPSGATPAAQTPSLYYQAGRSQILKRGMEMLPSDVSTVYKRVFVVRIPKKSRRISDGDTIDFIYRCSSAESINVCGFAIYKEFY